MTRDDAIKLILMRCGMRQNDKTLQDACVVEMQLAQQTKLERAAFKPWFLLSENETTVTESFEERIPLPRGFLQEYEEGSLWIRDYDDDRDGLPGYTPPPYNEVKKVDYEQEGERFQFDGRPRVYSIVHDYFTLSPRPNGNYQLKMRYYKAAPLIADAFSSAAGASSNVWLDLAPDWLIGETGAIIAGSYIKDAATAAEFKAQAENARAAIMVEHVARDEANRSRQMGDD